MKKIKILTILFLGVGFFVQAQVTRFVYQVSMKIDSTASAQTENAYLDVSSEKSIFYGEKRLLRDSILSRMRTTRSFDRSAMQNLRSNLDFWVEKTPAEKSTFYTRLGRDLYFYEEDRIIEWKILTETVKIGIYETQKAETQFAGRKWYAWFTQEIPFQDGPYKFKGLPGLIVKVEDTKGDYSFDLMQTKKLENFPVFENRGTPIKIKRTAFEKQLKLYQQDPVTFLSNSFSQGGFGSGGGTSREPGGFRAQIDPNNRKRMEERILEEVKKNNNPIEILK